jgi:hypothetical protein
LREALAEIAEAEGAIRVLRATTAKTVRHTKGRYLSERMGSP